eukprot:COSAG01_NODE_69929_length_260_cov_0.608696_1_plen_21_part_01
MSVCVCAGSYVASRTSGADSG